MKLQCPWLYELWMFQIKTKAEWPTVLSPKDKLITSGKKQPMMLAGGKLCGIC